MKVAPVMLPAGRAKLSINPTPTASPTPTNTIGMVLVAFFAAKAAGVLQAEKMTSTLSRTRSAARAGRPSYFPSAHRYSVVKFWPSIQPNSRRPTLKASNDGEGPEGAEKGDRMPIRQTFPADCASAARGAQRTKRRARASRMKVALSALFLAVAPLWDRTL